MMMVVWMAVPVVMVMLGTVPVGVRVIVRVAHEHIIYCFPTASGI